jgi:hypothetical protein
VSLNDDIHVYIIYYVEPIAICQGNLPLLLSVVGGQQEEETAALVSEPLAVRASVGGGIRAASAVDEATTTAAVAAAQPCLQGRERRLTHSRLTRKKYTARLTKMPSNNMKVLQRDEEVNVKAKNRLLTRSHGLP